MSQVPVYFLLSLPLVGAFAMFALGIVVIYQASRVLNLTHGAMAMVPAYLVYEMSRAGIPMPLALAGGIASGAVLGIAIERLFVSTLRSQGPTAQTVGTVAAFGLLMSVSIKIWGTTPRTAVKIFPEGGVHVGASILQWGEFGVFAVAVIGALTFFLMFKYTDVGLGMRAAADNRRAAALMGIDPDWTARLAWAIGGGLAGLAGALLAAVTILHPVNLSLLVLPGFVAALIGGLDSLPGAMAGAAIVGLVQGIVPVISLIPGLGSFAGQLGASQLVLTLVAFVVMVLRGARFVGADVRAEIGAAVSAPPARVGERGRTRSKEGRPRARRTGIGVLVAVALLVWPFAGAPFSILGDAIHACIILLVAISLVLLTGWVGQISLAQATFVGIGAFVTVLLSNRLDLSFPINLPVSAAIAGGAAALLGLVALRVRGLYLAVATLIFLWMSNEYLFQSSWLVGAGGSAGIEVPSLGHRGAIPFFDLGDRRTFYYVALAVAIATLWAVANVRDSKTGRAFFAVRGSEIAAASVGIDVTKYKLLAFAMSGVVAGLAGNLLVVSQGAISTSQFTINASLFYLSVAVVGGLASLGGAIGASILFAGLNEVFFRVQALAGWLDVVSAGLLAIVLLAYPGGLASLPGSLARMRDRLRSGLRLDAAFGGLGRRLGPVLDLLGTVAESAWARLREAAGRTLQRVRPAAPQDHEAAEATEGSTARMDAGEVLLMGVGGEASVAAGESTNGETDSERAGDFEPPVLVRDGAEEAPAQDSEYPAALEVEGLTVRFGGLVAVEDMSLSVREGEIVGLIGPNGAGKTTIFNAVSGLVIPTEGTVRLFGEDVTTLPVHQRAAMGLARTFQVLQLFPQLTVFENLLVATHLQNPTGVVSHLAVTRPALIAEDEAREHVWTAVAALGLEEVAERQVAGLPFGVLRMVEVARALVAGAPLIMLDEPASGLDNVETDRLTELLRGIREELNVGLLLIEHDVRMVTAVSDYMYVINQGRLLAQGPPDAVQRDEQVIAAYLGEATVSEPQAAVGIT